MTEQRDISVADSAPLRGSLRRIADSRNLSAAHMLQRMGYVWDAAADTWKLAHEFEHKPVDVVLSLPWPPSLNGYYRHPSTGKLAGRTLISEDGRRYRADVGTQCLVQLRRMPRLAGRLTVDVELNPPNLQRRDVMNYEKGLCDALTHAEVWLDDEQIDRFTIWRGRIVRGGRCVVTIRETKPATQQHDLLEGTADAEGLAF